MHIEKPGPSQISVWDFPRPPRVEAVDRPVRVEYGGVIIAASGKALRVCETASPPTYYIPPADVAMDYLQPATGGSLCEWKGAARYWDVLVGKQRAERAAWSYPQPTPAFAAIQGYLAFYAGKMSACFIGTEKVQPQAGPFYGGWITAELTGPFKGEPGTEHW
ncbi:MAG: DUF427 domain-containing protein [Anaerolineales bacterium]|nr:DUF427 domain-containing protein [Anaerolineales bacterium]